MVALPANLGKHWAFSDHRMMTQAYCWCLTWKRMWWCDECTRRQSLIPFACGVTGTPHLAATNTLQDSLPCVLDGLTPYHRLPCVVPTVFVLT